MNKWDEKNYTKQKTNYSHNSEIVEIDITKNMPSDLDANGWIDIGWQRKCPKCDKNIKYSSKQTYEYANVNCKLCRSCARIRGGRISYKEKPRNYTRCCPSCNIKITYVYKYQAKNAENNKSLCKSCRGKISQRNMTVEQRNKHKISCEIASKKRIGTALSEETCKKISNVLKGRRLRPLDYVYTEKHCNAISIGKTGKYHSEESRERCRIAQTGKIASEATKLKHRLNRIEQLKEVGVHCPKYNKNACQYFDWLNKWMGWNGKHAMNGGEFFIKELGYWIDYYEPTMNLIIEWDEYHHYVGGNLRKKDVIRQNAIMQHLRCDFYRINEKTKLLTKQELSIM